MKSNFAEPSAAIKWYQREPSPFAEGSLDKLILLEIGLSTGFCGEGDEPRSLRFAQLLLSAIVHGGLLDERLWGSWLQGLQKNLRWERQLWIELAYDPTATPAGSESNLERRWFADPITQMLIMRWQHEHPEDQARPAPQARDCLAEILALSPFHHNGEPVSIEVFLKQARLKWHMSMPSVLVEYAKGVGPSVSVSAPRWTRLVTGLPVYVGRPLKQPRPPSPQKTSVPPASPESQMFPKQDARAYESPLGAVPPDPLSELISALKKEINRRPPAKSSLKQELHALLQSPDLPISLEHLISFVVEALRGRDLPKRKPRTLLNYANELQASFSLADDQEDILDLPAEDLAELYQKALEALPDGRTIAKRLAAIQNFQGYVELRRPDLKMSFTDIWSGIEPSRVQANLISSADYRRILARFSKPARYSSISRLLVMLGFRAGLRVGEAVGLLMRDVRIDGETLELHIVPNQHRPLKSPSSRRMIPLDVLLDENEKSEFIAWYRERLKENDELGSSGLLFCGADNSRDRIDRKVTGKINRAIKDATGDEYLIFHHLRHSFASYAITTLLLPSELRSLPEVKGLSEDLVSHSRRLRISRRLLGSGKLGRGAVHAVSTLCGHAGTRTTLRSYCHLFDWLIGLHARRPNLQPQLTWETAQQLSGQPSSTAVSLYFRRYRARQSEVETVSPALLLLASTGRQGRRPLRTGTTYMEVLTRVAERKWGAPPHGLESNCRPLATKQITYGEGDHLTGVGTRDYKKGLSIKDAAKVAALRRDPSSASEMLVQLRWPAGVTCPYCRGSFVSNVSNWRGEGVARTLRKRWRCSPCGKKFSEISGTAMHGSRLPFGEWLYALQLLQTSDRIGLNRLDLATQLEVDYSTADFMYRRIWHAMQHTALGRAWRPGHKPSGRPRQVRSDGAGTGKNEVNREWCETLVLPKRMWLKDIDIQTAATLLIEAPAPR